MLPRQTDYYSSRGIDWNYGALAYAVYAPCDVTSTGALARVAKVAPEGMSLIDAETIDLVILRERGLDYKTIANFFWMNKQTVYTRIKRWKEKGHEY